LFGVHTLSKSIDKVIIKSVKTNLTRTSNPLKGLAIGTTVSAIAHSSSAVCVLSLSLCGSGIIALPFAASVILGANIGTTFTGLFAALSAVDISIYFGLLVLIGFCTSFAKNPKINRWSKPMIGLGLIFVGLNLTASAFDTPMFVKFLTGIFSRISFPPILIIISLIFTALVQSSTLTATLSISLAVADIISPFSAMYIVLGADAGTCITTVLAGIGGNSAIKQLTKFQVYFNIASTIVFGIMLMLLQVPLATVVDKIPTALSIALFHFSFNSIGAIAVLPFLNRMWSNKVA